MRQVWWSGIPIFLLNDTPSAEIYTDKDFSVINKAEVDAFLELSCFIDDLMNVLYGGV